MNSDADVPTASVRLESDEFACGAYSIAQAMTKAGEKSYLYHFTYVDPGRRSRLGAHHGEELFFLTDSFPADWESTNEDKHLPELLRGYPLDRFTPAANRKMRVGDVNQNAHEHHFRLTIRGYEAVRMQRK